MQKERDGRQVKLNIAISAVLSFLGTWCLPRMMNLKGNNLGITNSYISVFVWAACTYAIYRAWIKTDRSDRRGLAGAGIFSFMVSASSAFGAMLDYAENVDFTSPELWIAILVWTGILTLWVHRAWTILADRGRLDTAAGTGKGLWQRLQTKWNGLQEPTRIILVICFFMLCWLPVFLAVYPGFFVYDAQDELVQVQTRNFTTHHPLPHVVLLGGIILAVNKLTGSYNLGIAAYTLFQMLLMASVFAYVLYWMKKRGLSALFRLLTALYLGLFPVIVMFTLCSAKDGIFTAALLLLFLFILDMITEKQVFFKSWKRMAAFLISAVVMMCFRHNGMYAFLVMVPVLLITMKGQRKKLGILLLGVFGVYFAVTSGFTALLLAEHSENQEILTVPIQQMARTYKYDKESFSEEDLETLYEVIPEEALDCYTAKVSDGVKIWFNNEAYSADPGKYGELWLKMGLKHPFTYLNAWFMTSYGFWYPDTVIDVYRGSGVFTFTYEDSSFFGYEVEQPGIRESKFPWLNEWYRKMSLEITQQKIPVVSMLFSPGFLFWVMAFTIGYCFYGRKYNLLIPFTLLMLVWLTVILGPTYLPRYVLFLWFLLPVEAAVLVNKI